MYDTPVPWNFVKQILLQVHHVQLLKCPTHFSRNLSPAVHSGHLTRNLNSFSAIAEWWVIDVWLIRSTARPTRNFRSFRTIVEWKHIIDTYVLKYVIMTLPISSFVHPARNLDYENVLRDRRMMDDRRYLRITTCACHNFLHLWLCGIARQMGINLAAEANVQVVVQRLQDAQFHGVRVWGVKEGHVKSETYPNSSSISISYGGGPRFICAEPPLVVKEQGNWLLPSIYTRWSALPGLYCV